VEHPVNYRKADDGEDDGGEFEEEFPSEEECDGSLVPGLFAIEEERSPDVVREMRGWEATENQPGDMLAALEELERVERNLEMELDGDQQWRLRTNSPDDQRDPRTPWTGYEELDTQPVDSISELADADTTFEAEDLPEFDGEMEITAAEG